MGIKIHRSWVSDNPSGVIINPGWYALAEAILTKQSCCVVLQKWCGVSDKNGWKKKDTSCTGEKMKQIIKIYRRHRGKIKNISKDPRYSKDKRKALEEKKNGNLVG